MFSSFSVPPASRFGQAVHSLWQTERSLPFQEELIVPKGVVEVIFNFSDGAPVEAHLGGRHYRIKGCFINGFNTAPIRLRPPERQVFFGVLFKPLAVKHVFGIPAGEVSDLLLDLSLLDPDFDTLWHQLAGQKDFDGRVALFLCWIERKLPGYEPREQLMNELLIGSGQYDQTATGLAGILCYSPRHLSRRITEATGLNAEELLLYKKYLRAIDLMHHTGLNLTEIAYEAGFSDQPHFIKAFKSLTGLTPGAYRRGKGPIPGHIFQDVR